MFYDCNTNAVIHVLLILFWKHARTFSTRISTSTYSSLGGGLGGAASDLYPSAHSAVSEHQSTSKPER